ncbi:MAG: hypothetical protein U0169_14710 [Polyangiaceae bacterium]
MISPRFVRVLPAFAATLVAVAFTAACAEDETQFSGPGGTASLLTPGGNVTPAAGSGGSAGTAGTGGAPAACVASAYVSDPNCTVKWTTDILPLMKTLSCSATGCHKPVGGTPPNQPAIDDTAGDATYEAMKAHVIGGKPYFNPCSKDPAASSFVCNTATTGACGKQMPAGVGVSGANATKIATWVACGAPKN